MSRPSQSPITCRWLRNYAHVLEPMRVQYALRVVEGPNNQRTLSMQDTLIDARIKLLVNPWQDANGEIEDGWRIAPVIWRTAPVMLYVNMEPFLVSRDISVYNLQGMFEAGVRVLHGEPEFSQHLRNGSSSLSVPPGATHFLGIRL